MTKTDDITEVSLHVFERAGLGKAPFRCVGMEEKWHMAGDHRQPGGSCDYCGNGILHCFAIRGADGRTFVVGSDCVMRTGDLGLIESYKTRPEVRAANRAKAKAKDERVLAEYRAILATHGERLAQIMVPGRPWVPGDRVSLLDDIKRAWGYCGAAGRARHLKALKARIATLVEGCGQ